MPATYSMHRSVLGWCGLSVCGNVCMWQSFVCMFVGVIVWSGHLLVVVIIACIYV